jgi:hypothetical protein
MGSGTQSGAFGIKTAPPLSVERRGFLMPSDRLHSDPLAASPADFGTVAAWGRGTRVGRHQGTSMLGSTAPVSCSRLHGTRFPDPPLTPAPAQWTMRSRRGGRVARPPAPPRHRSPCLHSTTSPRYPRHPAQASRPRGRRPLRCPPPGTLRRPAPPLTPASAERNMARQAQGPGHAGGGSREQNPPLGPCAPSTPPAHRPGRTVDARRRDPVSGGCRPPGPAGPSPCVAQSRPTRFLVSCSNVIRGQHGLPTPFVPARGSPWCAVMTPNARELQLRAHQVPSSASITARRLSRLRSASHACTAPVASASRSRCTAVPKTCRAPSEVGVTCDVGLRGDVRPGTLVQDCGGRWHG